MRSIRIVPLLSCLLLAASTVQSTTTNAPSWSLGFLIVNETGEPLTDANIDIAYLDTSKPGVVTPSNWYSHMSHTNVTTDKNGKCMVSGIGTPDSWQCNFKRPGYSNKFRIYSGPSNVSAAGGPGAANQNHTEMLVGVNASPAAYPKWKITIKAINALGNPVEGATAKIIRNSFPDVTGMTDSHGLFSYSGTDAAWDIRLDALKAGCYRASTAVHLDDRETYSSEKWNQSVTLRLDKIDPLSMYAKRESAKNLKENEPVGFDLMAGDWVAPYGSGTNADFAFTVKKAILSETEYKAELKLTFPNASDGIIPVPPAPNNGSPLLLPHSAPEYGYQSEQVWHYDQTQKFEAVKGYFFRVRTTLDEYGKVKSAYYGKINGDIRFFAHPKSGRTRLEFMYYLNPNPNSRDVEFNPDRNLFKNLGVMEEVKEP